jgi:hypothetical protein
VSVASLVEAHGAGMAMRTGWYGLAELVADLVPRRAHRLYFHSVARLMTIAETDARLAGQRQPRSLVNSDAKRHVSFPLLQVRGRSMCCYTRKRRRQE